MIFKYLMKGLPKSNLIKPAIIAAAELVLHRKQDKTLDESIPIPLQTSQMTVKVLKLIKCAL